MRRLLLATLPLACLVGAIPLNAQDLTSAIADALANAPAVEAADAGEKAAQARVDQARAEGNPLARIEGSAGKGYIDNGNFFGLSADDTTPVAAQAVAEMPLYTGGRVSSAIDQAKGGAAVASAQAVQARSRTVVQTVKAYTDVLTARKLEQSYGTLAGELREVERQASLRYKVGEIASTEVAQARARRAEAEAGLAQAQGKRASAEAAYQRLTGKPAGDLAPLPPPPPIPESLDAALDLAHENNPALQQAAQAVKIAEAGSRSARAEGMPMVSAYAEAAHVRDQFFPGYKADSVSVGLRGRWTVFGGGRVAAKVRAADADQLAAEARERDARLTVDGMVIDAWQGYQTAERMLDAARLRRDAAAEALRGTKLEAKVGAKPTLAVLDAEREAIEAESALLEAESQYQLAAWQLNALTGNLP
ncbi:MAG: TolC family protein [Sphingomonadales bacterium]|nr:TolC family protein [Sphingomonadales bacterium]MBD3772392.1 TolC family protein [Paracoccaceae bacterium]